jgi:hypothetical protein
MVYSGLELLDAADEDGPELGDVDLAVLDEVVRIASEALDVVRRMAGISKEAQPLPYESWSQEEER